MICFRDATENDLLAITHIYNSAVRTSAATFQIQEKSLEEQQEWFSSLKEKYPFFIAEDETHLLGFSYLSPWADRCAYSRTVEISTYVREGFQGRGIGRELKQLILEKAKERGFHSIISRIAGSNPANQKLNAELGFQHIGVMKEVGFKFGRFHDVHLLQKML